MAARLLNVEVHVVTEKQFVAEVCRSLREELHLWREDQEGWPRRS